PEPRPPLHMTFNFDGSNDAFQTGWNAFGSNSDILIAVVILYHLQTAQPRSARVPVCLCIDHNAYLGAQLLLYVVMYLLATHVVVLHFRSHQSEQLTMLHLSSHHASLLLSTAAPRPVQLWILSLIPPSAH